MGLHISERFALLKLSVEFTSTLRCGACHTRTRRMCHSGAQSRRLLVHLLLGLTVLGTPVLEPDLQMNRCYCSITSFAIFALSKSPVILFDELYFLVECFTLL